MKLSQITISCIDVDKMKSFYEAVLNVEFKEFKLQAFTLYLAKLNELTIQLCPNELAQVEARQNRQQLDFITDNLEDLVNNGKENFGQLMGEIETNEKETFCTLIDPDGNTINFRQNIGND